MKSRTEGDLLQISTISVIRALLEYSGLQTRNAAEAAGMSLTQFHRLTAGGVKVGLHTLFSVAEVFGMTGEELLSIVTSALDQAEQRAAPVPSPDGSRWVNLTLGADTELARILVDSAAHLAVGEWIRVEREAGRPGPDVQVGVLKQRWARRKMKASKSG